MKAQRKVPVWVSPPEAQALPCTAAPHRYRSNWRVRSGRKMPVLLSASWKIQRESANKPRWLVFNKIDLMDKAEAGSRKSESHR
ncbi:hypothetical protein KIF59_17265 [Enterobacter cloacae subsp. cloacae]|nr:hypothetical protein [Enterobacter cloacae subsp. cloacae]